MAGGCWLAYDFGAEFRLSRLAARLASDDAAAVIPVAVGAAPLLMGIVLLLALAAFALRYVRHGSRVDIVTAGLMLGAVALTIPPLPVVALVLVIGAGLWVAARKSPARGLLFAAAAVVIALVATMPTLMSQGWRCGIIESAAISSEIIAIAGNGGIGYNCAMTDETPTTLTTQTPTAKSA